MNKKKNTCINDCHGFCCGCWFFFLLFFSSLIHHFHVSCIKRSCIVCTTLFFSLNTLCRDWKCTMTKRFNNNDMIRRAARRERVCVCECENDSLLYLYTLFTFKLLSSGRLSYSCCFLSFSFSLLCTFRHCSFWFI